VAALACLWQQVVLNGCDGQVVPVPVRPSAHTELLQVSYGSAAPDAARQAGRRARWKEHESGPGAQVIQPVLTAPLDWARRRWKLPAPAGLRLELTGADEDLLAGLASVADDPGLRVFVVEAVDRAASALMARYSPPGWHVVAVARPDEERSVMGLLRQQDRRD
jgi:hypothetical protein